MTSSKHLWCKPVFDYFLGVPNLILTLATIPFLFLAKAFKEWGTIVWTKVKFNLSVNDQRAFCRPGSWRRISGPSWRTRRPSSRGRPSGCRVTLRRPRCCKQEWPEPEIAVENLDRWATMTETGLFFMGLFDFVKLLSSFLLPVPSNNLSNIKINFWNAENQTQVRWLRSKNANSVLCSPLIFNVFCSDYACFASSLTATRLPFSC